MIGKAAFSETGCAAFAFLAAGECATLPAMTDEKSGRPGYLFPMDKGSYLLLFENTAHQQIKIGKKLRMNAPPGFFVYAGSALAPGGLAARLGHHCRPSPNPRWHVDYLKSRVHLSEVWYLRDGRRLECELAKALMRFPEARITCPGFGSSDCKCETHLVYLPKPLPLKNFSERLAKALVPRQQLERHRLNLS